MIGLVVLKINGVEFCQKFVGVIRCSLGAPYDDVRHHLKFSSTDKQMNKATYRGGAHLKMEIVGSFA